MADLIDMEMDDEAQIDHAMPYPMPSRFRYPPGLRICLCDGELDKLGLDADCEDGDFVEIRAHAVVLSVHKEDGRRRVELQIEKMALDENDDDSDDTKKDD